MWLIFNAIIIPHVLKENLNIKGKSWNRGFSLLIRIIYCQENFLRHVLNMTYIYVHIFRIIIAYHYTIILCR